MSTSTTPLPRPRAVPDLCREELAAFLEERRGHAVGVTTELREAVDRLADFTLGAGKRIRPLYAWAGYLGAGGPDACGEDPRAVLRAVSALEFIQSCALIHDDIIDHSDSRRGAPTLHRRVAAEHRLRGRLGCPEEHGRAVAILIGDLALIYAEDMLRGSGLGAAALDRAGEAWRALREEVIAGQLLDISLEAAGGEDILAAERVNLLKTAAYTVERPLQLGAEIAGAGQATVRALREYGRDVGVAFQLRDDLLGVFGDPEVTGKPAGDDLREGKRTVLLCLALQRADESDPAAAGFIRSHVGRTRDPELIAEVAARIAATGVVEQVESRIAELVDRGMRRVERRDIDPAAVELLHRLAVAATTRER